MDTSNGTHPSEKVNCFFLEVILLHASHKPLYISTVITSVINAIVLVFVIVGNSIILTVVLRTTALQTCSNLFLGNLVLSDLFVGAMVQPFFIIYKTGEILGKYSCVAHALFSTCAWLCAGVSFLTLTALNCERHIAIFAPLRYKTLVTARSVKKISFFIWLLSLLLVSSRFYGLGSIAFYAISCAIVAISLVTFLVISVRIHCVVQRHRKQIAVSRPSEIKSWRRQARETGHAKNVAWLTLIFFACYLPTLIIMITYTLLGYTVELKTVYLWSDTLVFINSSFNPAIYCWRNKGIRKAVFKVLSNLKRKASIQPREQGYPEGSKSAGCVIDNVGDKITSTD